MSYSNKFQYYFVTSQQRIWTELPQAGTKATPDTREGRKEMIYLTTHSTYFLYGYMASNIWLRTTDTRDEKKRKIKEKKKRETGLWPLDCSRVEKCCFLTKFSSLYLVTYTVGGHWGIILTKNMM